MDNMTIYDALRTPPDNAQKPITGGRLKGMTDINPMWRIKALTQQFGPCGLGWWYVIKDKRLEPGSNGQIAAFVDIDLYYRWNGETSQPIPGTGGSMYVVNDRSGAYTGDECFKMALTDAISVSAKALGMGADVYWGNDPDKYLAPPPEPQDPPVLCPKCGRVVEPKKRNGELISPQTFINELGSCYDCYKASKAQQEASND